MTQVEVDQAADESPRDAVQPFHRHVARRLFWAFAWRFALCTFAVSLLLSLAAIPFMVFGCPEPIVTCVLFVVAVVIDIKLAIIFFQEVLTLPYETFEIVIQKKGEPNECIHTDREIAPLRSAIPDR